jgi:hypothetical protein
MCKAGWFFAPKETKRITTHKFKSEKMTKTQLFIMTLISSALFLTVNTDAIAKDERDLLGSFRDWDTFKITSDNGNKQCYMISTPTTSTPKGANRGSIYLTITHVPHLKRHNEINTVIGYPFKVNSEATVSVGKRRFRMFTSGDGAWLSTPKQDLDLVSVMKKGSSLVIRGQSKRGTRTADTYSLMGFTAAYNTITKACN